MLNSSIQSSKQQLFTICAVTVCAWNICILLLAMALINGRVVDRLIQLLSFFNYAFVLLITVPFSHIFLYHTPYFVRKHFKQVFCSIFFALLQGFEQIPSSMLNPIMGTMYLLSSQFGHQSPRIFNKQVNYFPIFILSTLSAIYTKIFLQIA